MGSGSFSVSGAVVQDMLNKTAITTIKQPFFIFEHSGNKTIGDDCCFYSLWLFV
jgi:hypothetical protein